ARAMWSYIQNFGDSEAVPPRASPTWTVNCSHPELPLNAPLKARPFSEVPDGSGPWVTAYVYGPAPPLCCPNAPHTVTQPSSTLQYCTHEEVRPAVSAGATPIVPEMLAVLSPASATWMVKEKLPALVGVTETDPFGPSVSPA